MSIDTLQKHVDEIRAIYSQIKKDYMDIDAAEATHCQMAFKDAVARLTLRRQQLIVKLYELGVDAIGYYNGLDGKPQREVK